MRNPFLYKIQSGKTIGDIVLGPVQKSETELNVIDVGARNGLFLLPPDYAKLSNLIGFEPNPEEYKKLVEHSTDAMKTGLAMPKFKSEKYHDCALWNKNGTFPLYVTVGPGATTMMGETNAKITDRIWLEGDTKSYEATHSRVDKVVSMNCRRLDSVIDGQTKVDFLKVDTEGADLAVLEGAESFLKSRNILFIRSEFQFLSYYKTHPLFGDQQLYLNKHNFRFLGMDLDHPKYTRDKSNIPSEADRRLIYAGDAYFMLDPDRVNLSALDLHRMALVCLIFGFHSLAVSLLRQAKLLTSDDIDHIEQAFVKTWTKRRVLNLWGQFPYNMRNFLRKIKIKT